MDIAQQIDCISTERDPLGRRQITHVGGPQASGGRWKLSVDETIHALQTGSIYFATFERQSYIVTVGTSPGGRRFLSTALGEADSSTLLRLPERG